MFFHAHDRLPACMPACMCWMHNPPHTVPYLVGGCRAAAVGAVAAAAAQVLAKGGGFEENPFDDLRAGQGRVWGNGEGGRLGQ